MPDTPCLHSERNPNHGKGDASPTLDDTREITKEVVLQYLSGAYSGMLQAHSRWRRHIVNVRILIICVSALSCILLGVYAWRESQAAAGSFLTSLREQSPLLVPAIIVGAVGSMPYLWRFGWEPPAFLVLILMGAQAHFFGLADKRSTIAVLAFALTAIVYGVYLRTKRHREPLDLDVLEANLDAWTSALLARTLQGLDLPNFNRVAGAMLVLRSLPRLDRSGSPDLVYREGLDCRIRLSPLGFAAFIFDSEDLVVIEGAIDLIAKQMVYMRARQFRYEDVVELIWSSETTAPDITTGAVKDRLSTSENEAGNARLQARGSKALRQREILEIRLLGGRSVLIVFSDSQIVPTRRLRDGSLGVEDKSNIRTVWNELSLRQARARSSARASSLSDLNSNPLKSLELVEFRYLKISL